MPVARNAIGITEFGHWQRTLGRHVWILRRAGVTSAQMEREIAKYLGRCRKCSRTAGSEQRMSACIRGS